MAEHLDSRRDVPELALSMTGLYNPGCDSSWCAVASSIRIGHGHKRELNAHEAGERPGGAPAAERSEPAAAATELAALPAPTGRIEHSAAYGAPCVGVLVGALALLYGVRRWRTRRRMPVHLMQEKSV